VNPSSQKPPVPRLVPEEPLPPYSFVPGGQFPHPESDPAGHAFGRQRAAAPELDPARWQAGRPYLYGLDLFNAGFYWESHVEFESLWLAAGRKGVVADFLKGLIHLAAAGVKDREEKPRGVKSHARRAAELWREVARSSGTEERLFLGLRPPELIGMAETVSRDGWPHPPPVLLPTFPSVRQ
jgi:uncharacterized protein